MNTIAERYVKLVLALGQHDAAYVDAFYGPPEWKTDAEAHTRSLAAIGEDAEQLIRAAGPIPSDAATLDALRHEYLVKQLQALAARVRMLSGTTLSFDEESAALYDAVAPTHPDAFFQATLDQLNSRLVGHGSLVERYDAFRQRFEIPKERLSRVFDLAIAECRRRTLEHLPLPAGERFTVEYVTNKSWSGYNWYQGNYHSLIQVNTDLPIYIDRAVDLACHEGYPGHHVYNALLEKTLVRDRGWVEMTVYPLFSPQSLIAEGSANYGIEVAFPGSERVARASGAVPGRWPRPIDGGRILRGAGARGQTVLRRQRSGAPVPERRRRSCRDGGLAHAVRAHVETKGRAANAFHGRLSKLRHQLQPR
jgi:hypothetical protein